MRGDHLTLYDRDGNLMVKTKRSTNHLYKVTIEAEGMKCLQLAENSDSTVWHARLGHVSTDTMKSMLTKEMVTGMPNIDIDRETCSSCLMGKQTRATFPKATTYRATHILELVHGDLCGPISPPTAGRKRYIFVLIDEHSRYMWSILMEGKDEAFERFQTFKRIIEKESGATIKTLRTDRGGEFNSHDF